MKQFERNPSLQCRICGKWMRLHGQKDGKAFQRFYAGYETTAGEHIEHDGNVRIFCERDLPGYKPFKHPVL